LAGKILGSLIAFNAATGYWLANVLRGFVYLIVGGGINSRCIAKESKWNPMQSIIINSFYSALIFFICNNRWLLAYVLDEVATRELLSDTLKFMFKYNPDRIDDELVDSFYLPAKDDGSIEALSQIYRNDTGVTR